MTSRPIIRLSLDYRFCLGVQWHPEYALSRGDEAIFEALVDACSAAILKRLRA